MNNININTTLDIVPKSANQTIQPAILITRGSSFSFSFDLSTKAYTFDQIEQLIVIFGSRGDVVSSFKMYAEEPIHGETFELDRHFSHTQIGTSDFVVFTLLAEDTIVFDATRPGQWLDCEMVIKLDGDDFSTEDRNMATIIEKQPAIGVIDSLYGHLLGD